MTKKNASAVASGPSWLRERTISAEIDSELADGDRSVILDRDIQLLVNDLWAAGAEAIAIGGVRLNTRSAIRQAGGAILVDNHPITGPYTLLAIGPPNTMRDNFERSPGLNRLRLLEASYGAGVTVSTGDGLTLPAGAGRDVEFARKAGS